ncbi:MAG TPA: ATP-binding protein, partial [Actinomycetota bacterium]
PHSVRAPGLARDALAAIRAHMSPQRYADLRLLVSELVSNSVVHGAPGEAVHLRVGIKGGVAEVEVEDAGRGSVAPSPGARPGDESGRGLQIVEMLADRWGVASSRPTRVWFQVGAEPPGMPGPR